MREVRAGDARKLAVLFERHHQPLFRFFVRMTGDRAWSEDLVQEVFFRVLKYRQTFCQEASFTAWMYRIARNVHIDQSRRKGREVSLAEDWDGPARPGVSIERRQEEELLQRALLELPADKRELLVLSRFQEMKYEDIAELVGCEVGTVKVRIHRAVQALRKIFFELEGRKVS